MASIVAAWPTVALSEVLVPVSHPVRVDPSQMYSLLGMHWYAEGLYVKERKLGAQIQADTLYEVREGDFVYNRLFGWKGSFGVVTADVSGCHVSNEFPSFYIDGARLYPGFLRWYFSQASVWDYVAGQSSGSTPTSRLRLKEPQFLALQIPLPPLDEQRRIVAHIEALAAHIEQARGLRREALAEAEILFVKAAKEVLAPFAGQFVTIGSAFKVTTGSTPSRSNPAYWDGNIKWVSSGEVAFCRISDTAEKISTEGLRNSSAKVYPPGTVLLAMIGQGKTRGQCAILDCYAATNQNVAGIHVYDTDHLPEYVYWWLRSRYLESRSTETGTAQPALSGERVRLISIPLPELQEQQRIAIYLDEMQSKFDALKQLQAQTSAELDALLPSVLDKAFRGEL